MIVLVAEERGNVVGVVAVEGDVMHSLFVSPSLWRRGIGRALQDAAVELIAANGYERAMLEVLVANEGARALYERAGWTLTGRSMVSSFPPNPELVEYELLLPPSEGVEG